MALAVGAGFPAQRQCERWSSLRWVLGCHTGTDGDVIYIVDAFRMYGLPESHVRRIKQNGRWRAPAAWPHDGGRGASIIAGDTIAQVYRTLGLNMLREHATFKDGGYNFEAGIAEMEGRFATGRLVVRAGLAEFFDEYQGYHRVNGQVHKVDDDILSATRVLCMAIRHAKPAMVFENFGGDRRIGDPRARFAKGSANHPGGAYDLFSV